jgi:hypothetical protein
MPERPVQFREAFCREVSLMDGDGCIAYYTLPPLVAVLDETERLGFWMGF